MQEQDGPEPMTLHNVLIVRPHTAFYIYLPPGKSCRVGLRDDATSALAAAQDGTIFKGCGPGNSASQSMAFVQEDCVTLETLCGMIPLEVRGIILENVCAIQLHLERKQETVSNPFPREIKSYQDFRNHFLHRFQLEFQLCTSFRVKMAYQALLFDSVFPLRRHEHNLDNFAQRLGHAVSYDKVFSSLGGYNHLDTEQIGGCTTLRYHEECEPKPYAVTIPGDPQSNPDRNRSCRYAVRSVVF